MTAQLTHNYQFPLPLSIYQPTTAKIETQEPDAKRMRYDSEWSSSSGSSPAHSENEPNSAASQTSEAHQDETTSSRTEEKSKPIGDLNVQITSTPIAHEAKFHSFAEFETAFEFWKREQFHPFRVASSETLKESDGSINQIFRYRYVVYHCAHYGQPRQRGAGKRPNQSYLPCGCKAMLRLNYSFQDKVLKITTLIEEHNGHEQNEEVYNRATQKVRTPTQSPAARVTKRERTSVSSPLSIRNSPANSSLSAGSYQNSPVTPYMNVFNFQQPQQQMQLMQALLMQQKENMTQLAQQQTGYPFGTPRHPMMNLMSFLPFVQPAHGVVAPPSTAPTEPTLTAQEKPPLEDTKYPLPAGLPAPVPVRATDVPIIAPSCSPVKDEPEDIEKSEESVVEPPIKDGKTQLESLVSLISGQIPQITDETALLRAIELRKLIDSWQL